MLSVSHIAWPPDQEEAALADLMDDGLSEIEVAPLRAFGNPLLATEDHVRAKVDWYRERGFSIGSFQALLFGTDGLELFGTQESVSRLKQTLVAVGCIASWAGAGPLVFGSPKNRLRGSMGHDEARRRAATFFREVGDACAAVGSCLVIEANPEAYGADFCTTLEQAAELVVAANSPGFGLHLDAGGLAISGENFEPILRQSIGLLRHVHASQPDLTSFAQPHLVHARIAAVLRETGYNRSITIEMRAQPDGLNSVKQAVLAVREIYQC